MSTLPDGIFDELTSLTELNLGGNDLSTLPAGIFDELTSLTSLHLGDNDLSTLPGGIFDELTSLTELSLSENDLSTLPDGIFDHELILNFENCTGLSLTVATICPRFPTASLKILLNCP